MSFWIAMDIRDIAFSVLQYASFANAFESMIYEQKSFRIYRIYRTSCPPTENKFELKKEKYASEWFKTPSECGIKFQLTWIRMWSQRFDLCLTIVPQTMHFNLLSCLARCSSNNAAVLSYMPQSSQRKLLSYSFAVGSSVSSFDFWSISWFWRICAFTSIWLANCCWHTPHFFCLWYCAECACARFKIGEILS